MHLKNRWLHISNAVNKNGNKLAFSGNTNVASVATMFQCVGNIFLAVSNCIYSPFTGLLPMLPLLPVEKGHPRNVVFGGAQ